MQPIDTQNPLPSEPVFNWTFCKNEWFLVSSGTLKERYNRAMEQLCGCRTELGRFHIDMTGFSPEIADELQDPYYLNPHGINRRFILLIPEQQNLTLHDPMFSWTADILRSFMEVNRSQLFTLMARDSVYGEIQNSIYRLESVDELLDMRTVSISLKTPDGLLEAAGRIHETIDELTQQPEHWLNDARLNNLIQLAEKTGDIRRHPVAPIDETYQIRHYFTRHLDGLYRFDHGRRIVILSVDPQVEPLGRGNPQIQHHRIQDSEQVYRYLTDRRLVQTVSNLEALQEILRGFLLDQYASDHQDGDFSALTASDQTQLIHQYWDALPDVAKTLLSAIRLLEQGSSDLDSLATGDAFFYMVEPKGGEMAPLIHHLLANYRTEHFRYLYRWNRALFWQQFEHWPPEKQNYAGRYITRFGDQRPDSAPWR